jgi:hypothetical protein
VPRQDDPDGLRPRPHRLSDRLHVEGTRRGERGGLRPRLAALRADSCRQSMPARLYKLPDSSAVSGRASSRELPHRDFRPCLHRWKLKSSLSFRPQKCRS